MKDEREEEQQILDDAETAGAQYAIDQTEGDHFRNWVYEQMVEAKEIERREPGSTFPLKTKADYKKLARNMLQQLEWDTKRGLDTREILELTGANSEVGGDTWERIVGSGSKVVAAFYRGFSESLRGNALDDLVMELERINREVGGKVTESRTGLRDSSVTFQQGERLRIRTKSPMGHLLEAFWYTVDHTTSLNEVALQFAQTGQPGMFIEIVSGKLKWTFQQSKYAGHPSVTRVRGTPSSVDLREVRAPDASGAREARESGQRRLLLAPGHHPRRPPPRTTETSRRAPAARGESLTLQEANKIVQQCFARAGWSGRDVPVVVSDREKGVGTWTLTDGNFSEIAERTSTDLRAQCRRWIESFR